MNLFRSFLSLMLSVWLLAFTAQAHADESPVTVIAKPKIINGTPAQANQVPWQAALFEVDNQDVFYVCGATLINKKWLVTAAHCFDDVASSTKHAVLLGAYDLSDATHGQLIEVSRVIKHPSYNARLNLDNDIALLQLKQDVDLQACGARCKILSWLSPDHEQQFAANGMPVQLAGWGQMINIDCTVEQEKCVQMRDQIIPSTLQVGQLQVVACPNIRYEVNNQTWPISSNMMCAYGANAQKPADTCAGDSGSGMVANIAAGQPLLAGITSWGQDAGCGDRAYPGVYTRISQYDDWLLSYVDPTAYAKRLADKAAQAPAPQSSGGGGGSVSLFGLLSLFVLVLLRKNLVK